MEDLLWARWVKRINFGKKRGDLIRLPKISRLGVRPKSPKSPVEYQALTENEWSMRVQRYTESSFMIEDLVEIFAHTDLRSEYTREAGQALARDLDYAIMAERAAVINYNGAGNNTTTSNSHIVSGTTIGRADILAAIETLDRRRVPKQGRKLIVTPAHYSSLLTINEFISRDYTDAKAPTQTGEIGTVYGVPVIFNNNMGVNSNTGLYNGDADTAPGPTPGVAGSMYYPTQEDFTLNYGLPVNYYSATLFHPDAFALAVSKMPNAQAEWDIDYQAWKVVNTQIYDCKLYRPDHAVVISTVE